MTDKTIDTQETEDITEDSSSLTINSVFDDSEDTETEETQETESTEEKGETEEETVQAEAEAEESTEVETPATKEAGQTAALIAERKKRQAAEAELKALKAQGSVKLPDPVEDPEGYAKHLEAQAAKSALALKTSISKQVFKKLHADFEDMEKVFLEMVGYDPETKQATKNIHLVYEMNDADVPAEYVYQTAKEHIEVQQLRDPAYIEKIKAEAREEGRKLAIAEQGKPKKKSATEVPDLTNATASGNNNVETEDLDELDDIFKGSQI